MIEPITILLCESLQTSEVPLIWKTSLVKPVFKMINRSNISNYRGVALRCIILKKLDSIITHHINFYLKLIIDSNQHGFIKKRCTITNSVRFTSDALISKNESVQNDTIYLDAAKAFDSVDINHLIYKL